MVLFGKGQEMFLIIVTYTIVRMIPLKNACVYI